MAKKNSLQIPKKIIAVVLMLLCMSCRGQKKDTLKQNKMKTFDIQKFEKKKNKNEEYFYNDRDTIIKEIKIGNFYHEIKTEKNKKNYNKHNVYFENGNIKSENTFFLGINIEKTKIYNENGEIIREDDYTRPNFTFTVEQVAEKMKQDYNIDLYNADPEKTTISPEAFRLEAGGDILLEWWVVIRYMEDGRHLSKTYRIDGKDGHLVGIEGTGFGQIP